MSEEQINQEAQEPAKAMPTEEAKKDTVEDGTIICPCCGKKTLHKPLKLDPEWMDQYMACMLTGEPYSREYTLYNGAISITVTSLSSELAERVSSALVDMEGFDELSGEPAAIDAARQLLQVYSMIPEIRITTKGKTATFRPLEAVNAVLDSVHDIRKRLDDKELGDVDVKALMRDKISLPMKDVKKLSGLPVSSLRSIILIHDQMLRVLTESAFDQSFWSRIKLA